MKDTLLTVLATSKGWIVRQALKVTGTGLASFGAWASAKSTALNLPVDKVEAAARFNHSLTAQRQV